MGLPAPPGAMLLLLCIGANYKGLGKDVQDRMAQPLHWWRNATHVTWRPVNPTAGNATSPRRALVVVAMLGDSTTRNMHEILCEFLGTYPPRRDKHLTFCEGPGLGADRALVMGIFMQWAPTRMWRVAERVAIMRDWAVRNERMPAGHGVDAGVFGSTGLHVLHLARALPWSPGMQKAATYLYDDIRSGVRALWSIGACPVFHTVNWVCTEKFFGAYVYSLSHVHTVIEPYCTESRRAHLKDLCKRMVLHEAGTQAVYAEELRALAALETERTANATWAQAGARRVRIIDAQALTRHQCWATEDGVHFPPLLPQKVAAFTEELRACGL